MMDVVKPEVCTAFDIAFSVPKFAFTENAILEAQKYDVVIVVGLGGMVRQYIEAA